MRVVTLLPSATEIVYSLGVEPVGVSHECDYPPAARDLPSVNRARVDPTASSGEINEQVAAAEDDGGVYAIETETLAALDPDLIVTQGVCDVCAVDHVVVEDAVAELGLDTEVLTLDVHSLDDLFDSILTVGDALDRSDRAGEVVATLRARVNDIEMAAPYADDSPSIAVLDWMDPVMVAGHWVPEMIELAGGTYDLEAAGSHSRPREWEEIRSYDPDVLVVAPCGFDLDQTVENLADLTERPGWRDLTAVRNDRVVLVDGHHYVNRSGPRLVDTLAYLAWTLHPDVFDDPPSDAVRPLTGIQ